MAKEKSGGKKKVGLNIYKKVGVKKNGGKKISSKNLKKSWGKNISYIKNTMVHA